MHLLIVREKCEIKILGLEGFFVKEAIVIILAK